jgi:replicative DNA helicase
MICREAGVSFTEYAQGRLNEAGWARIFAANEVLRNLPLRIGAPRRISAVEMRRNIKSAARRYNARLVVVDYLGLITSPAENRTNEITKVSGELKAAAADVDEVSRGTLLVLSQLNRQSERENRNAMLSDLRDSGSIEQDADVVMFLENEDRRTRSSSKPTLKTLHILKQRNGPTNFVRLMYLPVCMGFGNYKAELS